MKRGSQLRLTPDPADSNDRTHEIFELNPIARPDVVVGHRFGSDADHVRLAVRIVDIGESHVPGDLSMDADGLNPLENAVTRPFQHGLSLQCSSDRSSVITIFSPSTRFA